MYCFDKYSYVTHMRQDGVKEIYAISSYAGKSVRGVAKCDPRDKYSEDHGKVLAAARCNAKVADKRMKRAEAKYQEAAKALIAAKRHFSKMSDYFSDAYKEQNEAHMNVNLIKDQM